MQYAMFIVVILALAMGVQSGVITLGSHHFGNVVLVDQHHLHDDGLWHGDVHDDGLWHGDDHDDGLWHGDHHDIVLLNGDHHDDGLWDGDHHDDGLWHGDHHGDWHGDHDHHAALVLDAHHVHAHHHEGQYIAKTRGAVHKAPLPGHIASAAAINVAPAPGTV